MFKDSKTLTKAIIHFIRKAQSEERLLSSTEILEVLESLKDISFPRKYIEAVIVCAKAHMSKDLNLKETLTYREEDVVLLIGNGYSTNQIAKSLGLSKFTVESHRKNIRKKFKHENSFDLSVFSLIYTLQHGTLHRKKSL